MFLSPGNIIVQALKLRHQFRKKTLSPQTLQYHTLLRLLKKSRDTAFGKHYHFENILKEKDLLHAFRENVPVHSYSEMLDRWWQRCLKGEKNVSWPGEVRYFALSSGTSDAASKHIPVTDDMIKSVRRVGIKQLCSLSRFDIPATTFQKGVLMLGSTTSLNQTKGYYEGDMSGISTVNMPFWISRFYFKPGQKIAKTANWQERIQLIVEHAPDWDIGMICGIPSWVQILLEEIITHYKVKNIHEIWPNLHVYIHGGVSFENYRESFTRLLGKPITYIETYMASEGSFGFHVKPGNQGIQLVLDAGIFFEFIPFASDYFDEEGNLKPNATAHTISEVKEGVDYAILLSNCAGAWRYLIGDVIKFTNVEEHEIVIVGRTRQFLNLCGEHVSIDNINKAVTITAQKYGVNIVEYTVAGIKYESLFAYRWYIGCDDLSVNAEDLKHTLDETLCALNDDYRIERKAAIKEVFVEVLPTDVFYGYLKWMNKEGGMNKFPRVLKGTNLSGWEAYLRLRNNKPNLK